MMVNDRNERTVESPKQKPGDNWTDSEMKGAKPFPIPETVEPGKLKTTDLVRHEINDENFSEHFTDVRFGKPGRGQVMARFAAAADLVDGDLKRDVIAAVWREGGVHSAVALMRRFGSATEKESYRVVKGVAEDLAAGLSDDEVAAKPYRYVMEMFFYVDPEFVPKDSPHWTTIKLLSQSDLETVKDAQQPRGES